MAESELHHQLKRAACRWLWDGGYAAVADEVPIHGVGVVDVVAVGKRRVRNPRRAAFEVIPKVDRFHVVFVECKAFRSDFIRDRGRQGQFAFMLGERRRLLRSKRKRTPRHTSPAVGKFDACLLRPHANLHYLLTPPRILTLKEIPRRWGLLVWEDNHIRVARRPAWQEVAEVSAVEGAVARSLTASRMRAIAEHGRCVSQETTAGGPGAGMAVAS